MKHPHIVDVCDLGAQLFGGSRLAYEWTGFMLLANNILLIGFHVFVRDLSTPTMSSELTSPQTGARIIQTLDDGRHCTVIWSVVVTVIG